MVNLGQICCFQVAVQVHQRFLRGPPRTTPFWRRWRRSSTLEPWAETTLLRPRCRTCSGVDSLECSRAFRGLLSARSIESDGRPDERFERIRVNLLTLVNVDGAPYVPVKARVEELGRIFQGSALKEGQLHYRLVRLSRTDAPSWDHTGVPLHFHSSTISGSASLMRARILAIVSPLQSPNSAILSLISLEAALPAAFC